MSKKSCAVPCPVYHCPVFLLRQRMRVEVRPVQAVTPSKFAIVFPSDSGDLAGERRHACHGEQCDQGTFQYRMLSIGVQAVKCNKTIRRRQLLHAYILEAATAHQALREVCASGALGLAAGSRLVDPPQPHAPAVQNFKGLAGIHAAKVHHPSQSPTTVM